MPETASSSVPWPFTEAETQILLAKEKIRHIERSKRAGVINEEERLRLERDIWKFAAHKIAGKEL